MAITGCEGFPDRTGGAPHSELAYRPAWSRVVFNRHPR